MGPHLRGDDSRICRVACVHPIQFSNSPPSLRFGAASQRSAARILCGAGYAVTPAPFAGPSFFPQASPREWSAKRRTSLPSCRVPHRNAGASRRSTAAISVPRVRVSWFPFRFLRLGRSASSPHRLVAPWPVRNLSGTVPVQQAPCGAVIVPPDRVPRPPGSGVTSHARRRRIPSRCQNVS